MCIAGLCDPDHRTPWRVTHSLADILRARILAIACGYADANDHDDLRRDPAFKLACGRLPESGDDLASQPTISRWENAPDLRTLLRLGYAMIDLWCRGHHRPPTNITLDIDDTVDVVHGHQQLSLFNAHYDERCFLPIHVYDADSGHCVAVLLRPGKTPSGKEIRGHLRRLIRRIRMHWPQTRITIRGDSHYGRPEVMDWCDANEVGFILGLSGNTVLAALVEAVADAVRTRRAIDDVDAVRDWTETRYGAKSWSGSRRVAARIECLYCARGQAENLIKLHKTQLASDRTSCRSPLAIRCGCCCTPPLTGWFSPRAPPSPRIIRWPEPSSPPFACGCSNWPPASTRPQRGCASHSPPHAPKLRCSEAWRTLSAADRHSLRGRCPVQPDPAQPSTPDAPSRRSRGSAGNRPPRPKRTSLSNRYIARRSDE